MSRPQFTISAQHGWKISSLIATLLTLSACTTAHTDWRSNEQPAIPVYTQTGDAGSAEQSVAGNKHQSIGSNQAKVPQAKIYPGSKITKGRAQVTPRSNPDKHKNIGGDIILNFADTPIRDAAQIILGDQLGVSFNVADDVSGTVSLNNQTGLAKADLLPTFEALLTGIDAQLINDNGSYKIRRSAAKQSSSKPSNLEILPLRYVDAAQFAKVLDGYQVSATPMATGNVLALNGSPQRIARVRDLARSFDVNWLKGMSIGLFPVTNTSAETLRSELLELFGKDLDTDLAGALRIVAIERSNTIMVIAASQDSVTQIGDWVERLDQVGGPNSQQFFIYRVQNGRAKDLAELLSKMFGGTPVDQNEDELNDKKLNSSSELQHGSFRAIADESTNSIIVSGSPHYYKAVREAMQQLDSTPLQVLIEARIMELTLKDDLQYGLEWFLNGSRASTNTSSTLDLGGLGIGPIQPGFSYVLERAGEVRAAINGLADDSRLKVLSSPSLMVLNNRTASILVGDEVPIPTRQAISNISPEAPTVNEIQYRNTGILLTVTPRVNSGGMVTMDISQEVSSVVNNTSSQIDAPTIQQRQLNSTVSIRNGQTVVLGGLIREQNSDRDTGVPVLKNIPGLGKLFSNTTNVAQRTELVVLITPRVITDQSDTDAITNEYQQKMIGLQPIPLNQL